MRHPRLASFALLCAVSLAASGCDSDVPAAGIGDECEYTFECPQGSVCKDGKCVSTADLIDAGHTDRDAGGEPSDGGAEPTDAGGEPVDAGADAGLEPDAGGADAGERVTFAPDRYRRCHDDLECAVFGGNCLIDLALSRPDSSGAERVSIRSIDPSFTEGEGICTLPCTNDPRICETITAEGPGGLSVPFTCQLVFAGTSPYPAAPPDFPFADQLDAQAMARGVPFASVCRPPFQYAAAHEESFCQACVGPEQCTAGSACFIDRESDGSASGSCVEVCDAERTCPFGFTCAPLPDSPDSRTFCLPVAGTCGRCLDRDGDLRGTGRCGPLDEPYTAVDCDDRAPGVFFDPDDPGHAFPEVCGPSDVNCNGLSDDAEQLGGESHCAACGDECIGRVGELPHSARVCVARGEGFACIADCEPGWADCDDDVSNGCEQQLGDNQIWAADADGDGRGSRLDYRYVCDGAAPAGWVQNRLDCDEANPAVYGGSAALAAAPELCDGLDNDCNGVADDAGRIVGEGEACDTGLFGVCAAGRQLCEAATEASPAHLACTPRLDPAQQALVAESCDGLDDDCDGQADEDVDFYADSGEENPGGPGAPVVCDVSGGVGICARGAFACAADSGWLCQPNAPEPTDPIDEQGIDSDCDGSDGDLSAAIFVRPVSGGGSLDGNDANDGSAQHPVATVQKALELACRNGAPCRDVFVEARTFPSNAPILVPDVAGQPAIRVFGGFTTGIDCSSVPCRLTWSRGTGKSTLVRLPPAASGDPANRWPFGHSYTVIEAASGTAPLSLLLDRLEIEVRAPDVSAFLQDPRGQNAPSLIGIACPARGCQELSLRDVTVSIENAPAGANGTLGEMGPQGYHHDGHDGCVPNDNCTNLSSFALGEWMTYPWASREDLWLGGNDGVPGEAMTNCPDGTAARGGNSAAVRSRQDDNANTAASYWLWAQAGIGTGGGSGGVCYEERIENGYSSTCFFATRGTDGMRGRGGGFSGAPQPRFSWSGSSWSPEWVATRWDAGYGSTGGGGGGGAGCIPAGDGSWTCPSGTARGGGGGAGGCGGHQGGSAGDGGSAVGLILAPPAQGELLLSFAGSVLIDVGHGGRGGNGGRGGKGAYGGWGGAGLVTAYEGGNGGDGGGGGGGAGGFGGSSIGVVRRCTRAGGTAQDGCFMNVPPLLLAAPAQYVSVGSGGAGGIGGEGGETSTKPIKLGRTDTGAVGYPGEAGSTGVTGQSASLFFQGN